MSRYNYENPVAITRDIHWVGFYDKEANLHCNPYLMIDQEDVVLFDPGSIPHFPKVMRKVIDLVNPKEITVIVASHQDPDICGNLAVVEDVIENPALQIAAHQHAIRFIRHYGVRSQYYQVQDHDFSMTLKSGRKLEFIFTPYLHASGAIMTYDPATRTLFSSDIFGAMDSHWELFAQDHFLDLMAAFHQVYMPNNKTLQLCMNKLETMKIDRILPQHGSILEGDKINKAIQFLKTLPCGIDLVEE